MMDENFDVLHPDGEKSQILTILFFFYFTVVLLQTIQALNNTILHLVTNYSDVMLQRPHSITPFGGTSQQ